MNEQEWLACADSRRMLEFVSGTASDQKLRLFACACCRRNWNWLTDERSRTAVEIAEWRADAKGSRKDCGAAARGADAVVWSISESVPQGHTYDSLTRYCAAYAATFLLRNEKWGDAASIAIQVANRSLAVVIACDSVPDSEAADELREKTIEAERELHCNFLRDILGNPFRPVGADPLWMAWADGTVAKFAQQIYEDRTFGNLPILADALEEAGCTNADLLAHCRHPGPHVRGCWAVDLLLGKA